MGESGLEQLAPVFVDQPREELVGGGGASASVCVGLWHSCVTVFFYCVTVATLER